ncbi:MAG: hypothetical protein JWP63_3337 [Candidatus Solibacter sp.]|jgi:hypothetical protein|nr:hypothetical protein [Candidatus Solibacter sp.]
MISRAYVLVLPVLCAAISFAQTPPVPPCGAGEIFPTFPEIGAPPNVQVWDRAGLGATWAPPECTGWKNPGFAMLVVTAGRFRVPAGSGGLLRRIGAISELQGIRYWSTTHQSWRTLISRASALEGSTGARHRKDFTPDELTTGRTLYFEQEDNLTGRATYELRIHRISPERMVFETENVTTMKYLFIPVFHPREIQSVYFLDRESDDVWRFYSIARTGAGASGLAVGHDASSINRAVAFYRHLAGIPTDQEPPPAR